MIIRYNKNHHVIEEHAYKPNLQDVPHPNLHRTATDSRRPNPLP